MYYGMVKTIGRVNERTTLGISQGVGTICQRQSIAITGVDLKVLCISSSAFLPANGQDYSRLCTASYQSNDCFYLRHFVVSCCQQQNGNQNAVSKYTLFKISHKLNIVLSYQYSILIYPAASVPCTRVNRNQALLLAGLWMLVDRLKWFLRLFATACWKCCGGRLSLLSSSYPTWT